LKLISQDIRFKINFSDSLANKRRRLIGRYKIGMSGGLFGLGIKVITEVFHCTEMYESLSMEFKI